VKRDDERELIGQCLQGDTDAFADLVRRYQDRIYNTVYRMTGHAEDAQDMAQEAFLKAYSALGQFQSNASFYTWLYRIAVNVCLSRRRRQKRAPATVSVDAGPEGRDLPDDTEHTRPSRRAEQTEARQAVQQAVADLPDDQRAVVVLKDFDGHSYATIAEIVDCPVGTVRSRLHRARTQLKDMLRAYI
jgi:RNA polymerase sigma-70 factor, ECF subfamily